MADSAAYRFVVTTTGHARRKYVAAHADPSCPQLKGARTMYVPSGFERHFVACASCVRVGRWHASDHAPEEFFDWWAAARKEAVSVLAA